MVENFFMGLEIIENTVVGGSLGLSMAPNTLPPFYEASLRM